MDQSKQREIYSKCAVCCQSFNQTPAPFIFCRNAHLCCPQCLSLKAGPYDYASFPCPLCLELTCKAAAVRCEWLPHLLACLETAEERAAERSQLVRQIDELRCHLQKSRSSEGQLRKRLEQVEKRKHKFSQNWRRALFSVVSKKNAEGITHSHEFKNFEKYPSRLISEMDRLSQESRKMQGFIQQLKKQNLQLSAKVASLQSEKDSLQLNWSGTYAKPVELPGRPSRHTRMREKQAQGDTSTDTPSNQSKIDNYLTSNIMEIFKEKVRNTEQTPLESTKRPDSKGRTYKKFLNMKFQELDERFPEANPKLLNSNLRRLRDVLQVGSAKKKERTA